MKSVYLISALLALAAARPAPAIEIATGSMLGPRYEARSFYVRTSPRSRWIETYSDGIYRRQARGKLMMIRAAQGLFEDEWLAETDFDPNANTSALIEALDVYKAHGVLGVSVSLQGANPRYSKQLNGVERGPEASGGRTAGALISAFEPSGELKPAWMERLARLIRAADERGMIVAVAYFSPIQDEVLEGPKAIVAAARNATRWLIDNDFRNVIIDVAEDWDREDGFWDHYNFMPRNVGNLILEVRDQFNGAAFSLPIGASAGSSLTYPSSLARLSDVVLLGGAGAAAAEKARRVADLRDYERPVLMIRDYSYDGGAAAPDADIASADALFNAASGWAYAPVRLAESFPFRYTPASTSLLNKGADPYAVRFRAVLEHIARLTLKKPPSTVNGDHK